MSVPDQTSPVRRGRRALRLTLIGLAVAAALLIAAGQLLSSR
jgi:hypothetical protein